MGDDWQTRHVAAIRDEASGYGMPLAVNGLCSVDPDNLEPAREGLKRCGIDLEALLREGVRTSSTRPGSGGRSTFKAPPGVRWIKFASKARGVFLELRATSTNLQDCLPGTVYNGKGGTGPYRQDYANGKTFDDAPELPADVVAWWQKMSKDVVFLREQQKLFVGSDAQLAVSAGDGKLAFESGYRRAFNEANAVPDILARHGYSEDPTTGRWAPQTATGAASVREIPGKDGLWQSDHASDPLHGTFDAWTAYVALDHQDDQVAAEAAFAPVYAASIRKEIAPITEPFTAAEEAEQQAIRERNAQRQGIVVQDVARVPVALDWLSMPDEPPEPRFVIPGWMPDGVVTLFAAHGGTGKSYMSLYIALCLATGRHPFSADETIDRARVLLYSAEDDMTVMQSRLSRYLRAMGITKAELVGWLHVLDATGCNNVLFAGGERQKGQTTDRFKWLSERVEDCGAAVLIFDNASDALDANENDRAKVRQFMSSLKRLAPAVLLLAHVDAGSSMAEPGEAKGYSGSTGWHNSARSRWFMARRPDSDDIVLTLPKVNYAKAGSEAVIRWNDVERIFQVESVRQGRAKAANSRSVLLGLLQRAIDNGRRLSFEANATNSVFNTLKDMDGFPSGLKTGDVRKEVSRWRNEGLVEEVLYIRNNRTEGISVGLTDKGRAESAGSLGAGLDDIL